MNDEQDRDAEEGGGCGDRAEDHHELTRSHALPRADGGQGRGGSAAETGEPRHTRPRDRPAQRAPHVLSRKGSKRLQSLVRDRAGTSAKSHEEARDAEEPREKRKQDRIRIDEGRSAEDRETEAACESLDPNRANEPMDAASAAPLRCEDRSEDANQKRGSPRPEMVREADRIS